MTDQVVGPFPSQAHAYLGVESAFHSFRFNPDQVNWDYQENINSQDTIGGRVVQLLSVNIQGFTVAGRAGSRSELQRMSDNVRGIMQYHIKTSRPVTFRVPSRNWNFLVYVQAMPQIGWDVAATSYPYTLQLSVEEDVAGIQTQRLETDALSRLAKGIGYNKGVHGGDPKAFAKIVKSVLSATTNNDITSGSYGPTPQGATPQLGMIMNALKASDTLPAFSFGDVPSMSGHITNSEHHVGNAVDIFGGSGAGLDNSTLVAIFWWLFAQARKGTLPIHCIIWNKYIYSREYSWAKRPYTGDSDHTTHVHVSGWPSVNGSC